MISRYSDVSFFGSFLVMSTIVGGLVIGSVALAQEPPKAPSCEEQTLSAVWRVRDGYEVQVAALVRRVQALEAEKVELTRAQAEKDKPK